MDLMSLLTGLEKYGPPGLFLMAFITNLIPGFPALYLTFVGAYGALVHDPIKQLIVVISAGVGAGLGKVVVFYTSNVLAGKSETIRRKRDEYTWVINESKRGVFLLVLLFASLPLPDDVLYIPLGISGFNPIWFATAVIIGKILLTALVLFLGMTYWELLEKYFGSETANGPLALVGIAVGTIIVTGIIFSIDWKRIYLTYKEKGILRGTYVFFEELFYVFTLRPLRKWLAKRTASTNNPKTSTQ
ncbi:MAG: VTT domain-containing protein [Desulfurococcales archaeon]|nr:VTT domain-containing protein [Desulfurococcales archaeon]